MKRWLLPILVAVAMMPLVAMATGTLTIPNIIGAQPRGNVNASLLDTNWSTIAAYVNAREVTFDVAANRPAAGTHGRYYFATDTGTLYGDTGSSWTTISSTPVYTDDLTGLSTTPSATNQVTVAAGAAASDDTTVTARVLMTLASATQGNTAGTWVAGNFQNKLDAGVLAASQTWHNFLIQRTDTGNTDILFSQSATAPTMPTNYTKKRRIGYFLTDGSSNIRSWVQDGDNFWYLVPVREVDTTNPGTGAVATASASCPNGVKTTAWVNVQTVNGTNNFILLVSPLDVTDNAPSAVSAPLGTVHSIGAGATGAMALVPVRTDTARSFRFRLSASGVADQVFMSTQGCTDRRGRG